MKTIRKIKKRLYRISSHSKYILGLCFIIAVLALYLCNTLKVNGKSKETSLGPLPKVNSGINSKENGENLKNEDKTIVSLQQQKPVEIQQVEQLVEKQQINQSAEIGQVEQSVEIQQVEQAVETQQVEQAVETQQVEQAVETQQVEQPVEIQQVEIQQESVNDTNIHKNSINGIEYKLMNQADARWKDVKYTTRSGTIGKIGCMITSVAVVSSAYDISMTPKKVMDAGYQHNYPSNSIPYFSANTYTCTMLSSPNKTTIIDNLKQGNVVVIKVKSASNFTTSQHYMALIDIKSDGSQIFVGNSYGSGTGTYNRVGWFATDVVLCDTREVHICVPSQNLINQYK